ncbi:hypothetical protein PMI08_03159 [Brevibacillus sp. CF112]|uniref:hypothetical protein n=1 Tax=Brevibacillus sp. CF112 TaxID=1144311 RepID=UPI0002718817|nr:hypothetical protein [Brevibacillus sp. CF112]EJL42508.1 hypothetical protein PMI08_03159 [Brevibacillus sp. CF112]
MKLKREFIAEAFQASGTKVAEFVPKNSEREAVEQAEKSDVSFDYITIKERYVAVAEKEEAANGGGQVSGPGA